MDITEEKRGNTTILGLKGKLDSSTSFILEDRLAELMDTGEKQFVIDCYNLSYISSGGLRVLHMAALHAKNVNAKLLVCSLRDHVRVVFNFTGFSSVIPIHESLEDALKGFE
jgi:anti-anti-sigma factor